MCMLEKITLFLNSIERSTIQVATVHQFVNGCVSTIFPEHSQTLWTQTILAFIQQSEFCNSFEQLQSQVRTILLQQQTNSQQSSTSDFVVNNIQEGLMVQMIWLLKHIVQIPVHADFLTKYEEQIDWKRILFIRLKFISIRWNLIQMESWLTKYFPSLGRVNDQHIQLVQVFNNMFLQLFTIPDKAMLPKGRPSIPTEIKEVVKFKYQQKNCERMKNIYKLHNLFTHEEVDVIARFIPNELTNLHQKLQFLKSNSKQ